MYTGEHPWYVEVMIIYDNSPLKQLGLVVQSIVSLSNTFVSDSSSLLECVNSRELIIFAEKVWGTFVLQKILTFKYVRNFNVSSTNDISSFEQPGPDVTLS